MSLHYTLTPFFNLLHRNLWFFWRTFGSKGRHANATESLSMHAAPLGHKRMKWSLLSFLVCIALTRRVFNGNACECNRFVALVAILINTRCEMWYKRFKNNLLCCWICQETKHIHLSGTTAESRQTPTPLLGNIWRKVLFSSSPGRNTLKTGKNETSWVIKNRKITLVRNGCDFTTDAYISVVLMQLK